MKSATITNPERQAAERGAQKPIATSRSDAPSSPRPANSRPATNAPRATLTTGRTRAPLSGRVHGTGAPLIPASSSDRATAVICNITEQSWILHRTHGTFVIAGRAAAADSAEKEIDSVFVAPDGAGCAASAETNSAAPELPPYALTTIIARTGAIDLGDKRTLEFPISARDIANDLAREINADGGESSYFGVFVCEGSEPTEAELDEARERLDLFYRTLVSTADKQWERSHNVLFISDLERRAARELKFEKEWSYEPQQRIDCPACGEKLKPNVAVCKVCGAVLDRAKAARFGLIPGVATASEAPVAQVGLKT